MIFDDILRTLKKSDAKYIDRISNLKPTLFDTDNIKREFTHDTKDHNGLFYIESYSLLIYIESKNQTFSIHFMPIFGYSVKDFVDKKRLYKKLRIQLQKLISTKEPFEDKRWTKLPYGDNLANRLKKACVDYFYDNLSKYNFSSQEACRLLKELHADGFITRGELVEYLMKFGQLDFDLGNISRYYRVAKEVSKVLAKPEEDMYIYLREILANFENGSKWLH